MLSLALLLIISSNVFAQESGSPEAVLNVQELAVDSLDSETGSQELSQVPSNEDVVQKDVNEPHIKDMLERASLSQSKLILEQIGSLFFTSYEHQLVKEARKGFVARAPTETEVDESQGDDKPRPKGPRELQVGGIVYLSADDWTVWINGQRVTPDRLPPEILDIRVSKDFVKLKWFDSFTNQIYPVKIKTHQRFNLDTRIFLPG